MKRINADSKATFSFIIFSNSFSVGPQANASILSVVMKLDVGLGIRMCMIGHYYITGFYSRVLKLLSEL
jgi:hypothetical protein